MHVRVEALLKRACSTCNPPLLPHDARTAAAMCVAMFTFKRNRHLRGPTLPALPCAARVPAPALPYPILPAHAHAAGYPKSCVTRLTGCLAHTHTVTSQRIHAVHLHLPVHGDQPHSGPHPRLSRRPYRGLDNSRHVLAHGVVLVNGVYGVYGVCAFIS